MNDEQVIQSLLSAREAIDEALSAMGAKAIASKKKDQATNDADLIHGVEAIGRFLGLTKRQAQHWLDTTDMPVIRTGRMISARRADLTEWLSKRSR